MLLPSLLVEIIVPRNAMHSRRSTGDDRQVVGVRQGGHGALRRGVEAFLNPGGHGGEESIFAPGLQVLGIEAIDADYDDGARGQVVGSAVELNALLAE